MPAAVEPDPAWPRIDRGRLLDALDALARIGAVEGGGVARLAFTAADKAGRDFVEARMRAMGLAVSIDPAGNLLGVRAGRRDGPIVLTGSHTDTVACGGRYDGSLGVLAGLEVLQTLDDAGIETERPLGVASFVNEEGARFMPDMMGSLYLRGDLTIDRIRAIEDAGGETIGACMDRLAFAGTDDWRQRPFASFVELHIEQGPVLETEGLDVGIVERAQGLAWYEIRFAGNANHAGATPMAMRQDAGYAAARLTTGLREMAGDSLRTTAGSMRWTPNLINVIAGEAVVTADLRHPDDDALRAAEQRLDVLCRDIAVAEGVAVSLHPLARMAPAAFDAGCIDAISRAVENLGYATRRMTSGAAHDAQVLASMMPAAMIFVPSRGGISHNAAEYTAPEHIEAGANVLLHTLLIQAG